MGFQKTFAERVTPAMDRAFGIEITLMHGIDQTEPFTAVWEKRVYQIADEEGFITSHESRDFMFPKSNAVVGSDAITPRAGDRIQVTENGTEATYEILPIGTLPAVEEMPGGTRWRVHAKRVE